MKKVVEYIKNNKVNCVLWFVFFALVITLSYSGTLAKYASQFNGSAAGTIAKFEMSVNFTGVTTNFSLEDKEGKRSGEYTFSVTSNSDVPVSYNVVVTLKEALPDTITLSIDGSELSISENGLVYTFYGVGEFSDKGGTNNHTLLISASDFYTKLNQSGITVQVIAEQKEI